MAREFAKDFYKSPAWRKTSKAFLNEKMHICERCYNKNGQGIIAHHKVHLNENNITNPKVALSWSNLECLCQVCHNKEHNKADFKPCSEGYEFDAYGMIRPKAPPK